MTIQKVFADTDPMSASYYCGTYNLTYLTDLWELKRVRKQLQPRMDGQPRVSVGKLFRNP